MLKIFQLLLRFIAEKGAKPVWTIANPPNIKKSIRCREA